MKSFFENKADSESESDAHEVFPSTVKKIS